MEPIDFDDDRKDIMRVFLQEAHQHIPEDAGPNPEFSEAIGLVKSAVAFEALLNEMSIPDNPNPNDWHKREAFCARYQRLFNENAEAFAPYVAALSEELSECPLLSMDTSRSRQPLQIEHTEDLQEVIEVVYRVRSNLVHGSKALSSFRNKTLIGNSFRFLCILMEIILQEEHIIAARGNLQTRR